MTESILPAIGQTFFIDGPQTSGIDLQKITDALQQFKGHDTDNIVILDDIQYTDGDVILPVVALDDHRIMYTFGKNFGEAYIMGTIYNGCRENPKFTAINKLDGVFQGARISTSKSPVNLSVAGGWKAKVYIISLDIMQANPMNQSIKFRVSCKVVPIKNKKA